MLDKQYIELDMLICIVLCFYFYNVLLHNIYYTEQTIPEHGIIGFQYYSGEGEGLAGCKAVNGYRRALMSLVLCDERSMLQNELIISKRRMKTQEENCDSDSGSSSDSDAASDSGDTNSKTKANNTKNSQSRA